MSATSPFNFLVFGAAGHIGGPCAEHLQTRRPDADIRVATSRKEKADALRAQHPGMDVCVVDYLDTKAMRAAFDGVEAALRVTPDFFDETAAMENVVDAAERCSVARPTRSHDR